MIICDANRLAQNTEKKKALRESTMAEALTEELLYQYKLAFSHFDKDGSGTITLEELKCVVDELGYSFTETEIGAMMMEMDDDANGSIDFSEFLAMMAKRMLMSDAEQEVLESFRMFDTDGDGELSSDELKRVLTTLGDTLTNEEMDEIITLVDEDGDGIINYREFVKLLLISGKE